MNEMGMKPRSAAWKAEMLTTEAPVHLNIGPLLTILTRIHGSSANPIATEFHHRISVPTCSLIDVSVYVRVSPQ